MKQFFEQYADLTALIITLLLPIALTIFIKRRSGRSTRALAVYFLFFSPSGILAFMFFHLAENSYHAVTGLMDGSFVYNFRFYSLLMFGLVLGSTGYTLLRCCLQKCAGETSANRPVFQCMLLVLLINIPLIPIIPLAYVPLILSGISLLALPFARRKLKYTSAVSFNEGAIEAGA